MGDVGAVMLTVPPGIDMLSIRIFGLLHAGVEDEVAGICLASVALFVVVALAVIQFIRTKRPFM